MSSSLLEYCNKPAINEVLGTLLNEPHKLREYPLSNEDFPELFHRLIYAAINNLVRAGADELDAVAIDEYLSRYAAQYRTFQNNDGFRYVEMIQEVAKPANIQYNYDQVRKFSLLRRYVQSGIDVSEYFDPTDTDPVVTEQKRAKLDNESIQDIINHFKLKQIEVSWPFVISDTRDSKKAGDNGLEQLEQWKKSTAWGIGYSSAYLTTTLHGLQPRTFTVRSAGTGVGKTRTSLADLAFACSPYYYDKKIGEWVQNPNGISNGALYIGTEMELGTEIDPILWAYIADVPEDHIKYNCFEPGEEERVKAAISMLSEQGHIWLEYLPDFTVHSLADTIEAHVLNHDVKYVWFDYIHSTPELLAEYGARSHSRMQMREDMALSALSTKLKQMSRDYDISLCTATQLNKTYRDEEVRDQTAVAGSTAIINKADNAMIATRPTPKELMKLDPILNHMFGPKPNIVYSVYKVREGTAVNIKIWLYVDFATMRTHDLFVTDYNYQLLPDMQKTYINIYGEEVASNAKMYLELEGSDDSCPF